MITANVINNSPRTPAMRDTMRPIMHPGRTNEETRTPTQNRGPGRKGVDPDVGGVGPEAGAVEADARGGYAREA